MEVIIPDNLSSKLLQHKRSLESEHQNTNFVHNHPQNHCRKSKMKEHDNWQNNKTFTDVNENKWHEGQRNTHLKREIDLNNINFTIHQKRIHQL